MDATRVLFDRRLEDGSVLDPVLDPDEIDRFCTLLPLPVVRNNRLTLVTNALYPPNYRSGLCLLLLGSEARFQRTRSWFQAHDSSEEGFHVRAAQVGPRNHWITERL